MPLRNEVNGGGITHGLELARGKLGGVLSDRRYFRRVFGMVHETYKTLNS